jgi:hypothetical protein
VCRARHVGRGGDWQGRDEALDGDFFRLLDVIRPNRVYLAEDLDGMFVV